MDLLIFNWHDFEEATKKKFDIKFPVDTKYLTTNFNVEDAKGFKTIAIFADSQINNEDLDELKKDGCERILLRSAGFNMVDVEYAKKLGIKVFRVASYSPESIAEFALTLILALVRKLPIQRRLHAEGRNDTGIDSMGFSLRGKTLGLHGYGRIARELADMCRDGLKMKVKYFDVFVDPNQGHIDERVETLEELYSTSDIVSIHVPLTPETEKAVTKDLLSKVKPGFVLINTSRGLVVDSEAVLEAVESEKIFYGTDVWNRDDKFEKRLLRDNSIQADHVAFYTEESVVQILKQTLENYEGKARPENVL